MVAGDSVGLDGAEGDEHGEELALRHGLRQVVDDQGRPRLVLAVGPGAVEGEGGLVVVGGGGGRHGLFKENEKNEKKSASWVIKKKKIEETLRTILLGTGSYYGPQASQLATSLTKIVHASVIQRVTRTTMSPNLL